VADLTWIRATAYSLRASGTHYRIARTRGPTAHSPALDTTRYTLWYGRLLSEQARDASEMPLLLGVYPSAAAARAAALDDLAAHPERGPC